MIWRTSDWVNVLSLTVVQNAGPAPVYSFTWSGGSSTAETQNIYSGGTNASNRYTTSYPSISFTYDGMITGVTTGANSSVTAYFTTNQTGQPARTGHVYAKNGNDTVGTWTLYQKEGKEYYFNWEASTNYVPYSSTSVSNGYSTNYPIAQLTFVTSGFLDSVINSQNSATASYTSNPSSDLRTGWVIARYNGTDVGVWTISQAGQEVAYFYWKRTPQSIGTTAATSSLISGPTSVTMYYDTNISSLSFTYLMSTAFTVNTGTSGQITVTAAENTTTSERTFTIDANSTNGRVITTVGIWTITQAGSDDPPGPGPEPTGTTYTVSIESISMQVSGSPRDFEVKACAWLQTASTYGYDYWPSDYIVSGSATNTSGQATVSVVPLTPPALTVSAGTTVYIFADGRSRNEAAYEKRYGKQTASATDSSVGGETIVLTPGISTNKYYMLGSFVVNKNITFSVNGSFLDR